MTWCELAAVREECARWKAMAYALGLALVVGALLTLRGCWN